VRTYSEQEARDAGLTDEWGELILPDDVDDAVVAGGARGGLKLRNPREVVGQMRKWTVRR
jgi:hypothetical protein